MITAEKFIQAEPIARIVANKFDDPEETYSMIISSEKFLNIPEEAGAGWIYNVCKYSAFDEIAKEKRKRAHINFALESAEIQDNRAENPESALIEKEENQLIQNLFALVNLTAREKEITNTRAAGFITLPEIAAVENISLNIIKHAAKSARKKLVPVLSIQAREAGYNTNAARARARRTPQTRSGNSANHHADQYHPYKDK